MPLGRVDDIRNSAASNCSRTCVSSRFESSRRGIIRHHQPAISAYGTTTRVRRASTVPYDCWSQRHNSCWSLVTCLLGARLLGRACVGSRSKGFSLLTRVFYYDRTLLLLMSFYGVRNFALKARFFFFLSQGESTLHVYSGMHVY